MSPPAPSYAGPQRQRNAAPPAGEGRPHSRGSQPYLAAKLARDAAPSATTGAVFVPTWPDVAPPPSPSAGLLPVHPATLWAGNLPLSPAGSSAACSSSGSRPTTASTSPSTPCASRSPSLLGPGSTVSAGSGLLGVAARLALAHQGAPSCVSPLAQGLSFRPSKFVWLTGGNELYGAGSLLQAAAIRAWLSAYLGSEAERAHLFQQICQHHHFAQPAHEQALTFLHVACLRPHRADALRLFRNAASLVPQLQDVMEQMLVQAGAKRRRRFASLYPHLQATFGLVVGDAKRLQLRLVQAVRQQKFGFASEITEQLEARYPQLAVTDWARFICDFEASGGAAADSAFMEVRRPNTLWARGIVATVQKWSHDDHVLAQGGLTVLDYRTVWVNFLLRYAALATDDFNRRSAQPAAFGLQRGDAWHLDGLFWSELIALPFAKPWAAYAADCAQARRLAGPQRMPSAAAG